MNIRMVAGAVAVFTILGLQGCASILGDSKYPIAISSAPPGASFEIADKNGQIVHSGNTPSTVTLKSGNGYFTGQTYTLRFKKAGYPDKIVTLDSYVSGWYWGNILFGGLIGMLVVDPATGAMYKLPEYVSADMGTPVAQAAQGQLTIVTLDSLTPSQRQRMVQIK